MSRPWIIIRFLSFYFACWSGPTLYPSCVCVMASGEAEFKNARSLLEVVSKPLRFGGIWPTDYSLFSHIRFAVTMIYHVTFIIMQYWDLVNVFGDLESMILNLMETTLQTIIIIRVLMVKFNKRVLRVLTDIEHQNDDFYKTVEEKKIRTDYYLIGLSFNRILLQCVSVSAVAWYFTPFINFLIMSSRVKNETVMLTTPFRLPAFVDISTFDRVIVFYIYEIGLNYFSVCYVSTCSLVSVAVNNICCQLSVLSYRISNVGHSSNAVFSDFCTNHLKTIKLVKTIDNAFHLIFLNELIMITMLISLIMYNMILHFDDVDIVSVVSLAGYGFVMISLIGLNCFISQNLIDQSAKLRDAYWKCEWYNMPISCRRALMISMIYSQIPLQLTAGKFYIYSMPNFLSILKSSMAYVSMLRTINDK